MAKMLTQRTSNSNSGSSSNSNFNFNFNFNSNFSLTSSLPPTPRLRFELVFRGKARTVKGGWNEMGVQGSDGTFGV